MVPLRSVDDVKNSHALHPIKQLVDAREGNLGNNSLVIDVEIITYR